MAFTFGGFIYIFSVKPFLPLWLAMGFNRLLINVAEEDGIVKTTAKLDAEYEKHVDKNFYVKWFFFSHLPKGVFEGLCLSNEAKSN